jgi:hypothetical protein
MASPSPTDSAGLHFVISSGFAIWVIVDSLKRKKLAWGYAIFSFLLLWWACLPFYLASRRLLPGETREGGFGWNVCKFFMLLWTFLLAYCLLGGMVNVSNSFDGREMGDMETAGAAIGVGIGIGFFFCLYVGVAIPVIITGLLLKKNSVIETGPMAAGVAAPMAATSYAPAARTPAAAAQTRVTLPGEPMISVARQGKNLGNYGLSAFKKDMASGLILPTDHYWTKGMPAWELVSNFKG